MRAMHNLTAIKIARLRKPGKYGDGGGLWLQISQSGTKSWGFRFMRDGKARQMGLGPLHTIGLAEAREKARKARALLLDGIDPIVARDAALEAVRAETAKAIMFKDAAERYIAAHRLGWKNAKHAEQWTKTLESYAYPVIGDLGVSAIDTGHVIKIIEPIWAAKTETASRVRGRIESVLDWATVRHFRKGDNPARWKGHLENLLPSKTKVAKVRHHPALAYEELPGFMERLREQGCVSARALEFTILTAARTSEAIGATWGEIDLKSKIWTVPADRIKSDRPHRVPLSARVFEILQDLPREKGNEHLFVGAKKGAGLSNMAMLELLRNMAGNGVTVHGFRSTFRDWAGDRTSFPREVAEAALAHVIGDKTEEAYRRSDALERRRRLMEAWSGFCAAPAPRSDRVVALQEARA